MNSKKSLTLISVLLMTILLAVMLPACAAGTGTVKSAYGSLHVLVTDANGTPVGGAKVVSNEQPEGVLKVTGGTNSEGTVTYNNLVPGHYLFYTTSIAYKDFDVYIIPGEETDITIKPDTVMETTTSTPPISTTSTPPITSPVP